MLGWMMIFAVLALVAEAMTFAGGPMAAALRTTGVFFSLLFLLGLFTRVVRGKTW
jgi:uncharacterized membrane protein YtjA (UPF0391 family)